MKTKYNKNRSFILSPSQPFNVNLNYLQFNKSQTIIYNIQYSIYIIIFHF